MLLPRVVLASNEALPEIEEVRRCGILSPVFLELGSRLENLKSEDSVADVVKLLKPLLRCTDCIIGTISLKNSFSLEAVIKFLNNRAVYVVVEGDTAELERLREEVPANGRDRIIIKVGINDKINASMQEFGGLILSIDISSESILEQIRLISSKDFCQETMKNAATDDDRTGLLKHITWFEAHWPRYKFKLLSLEGDLGGTVEIKSLVGNLHRKLTKGPDSPMHVVCNVSLNDCFSLISESFVSCLKTDRADGLFASVVADQYDTVLGLVYSSAQSIGKSVETGYATYFSRSRNKLWTKGEESGNKQILMKISFDCDADALKFNVIQTTGKKGLASFCHQNQYSCFGNIGNMGTFKSCDNLGGLFRVVTERKKTFDAKKFEGMENKSDDQKVKVSYTQRLLADDKMLRNKLLEESQEVMEAVTNFKKAASTMNASFSVEDRLRALLDGNKIDSQQDLLVLNQEVNLEAADLLYMLMTAIGSGNGDLLQVINELNGRSLAVRRRPGNTKPHRIEAAEKALKK